MVIAIRHKNQAQALESGRAALGELNSARRIEPAAEVTVAQAGRNLFLVQGKT
jgi:hypothetical protein